jgi:hypothetical protein
MVAMWQVAISIGPMMMGTLCSRRLGTAASKSSTSSATDAPSYDGSHCGEDPMPSVPEPIS